MKKSISVLSNCISVVCMSAVLIFAAAVFIMNPLTVHAGTLPAGGIDTVLSDANYINQDWMNHTLTITGLGTTNSISIGQMKDYPVNINDVNGAPICQFKKTDLVDAFVSNINQSLITATSTAVPTETYRLGNTAIAQSAGTYYQLDANGKNWILGILQSYIMQAAPQELVIPLDPQFLIQSAAGQSDLILSPDFIASGSCTTDFSTSSSNRCNNIAVAASHLNNMVVMPGQVVSISNAILPRTSQNGYLTAHAYSGGTVVDAIGGGICQVSSTVYNAARKSGISIVERHSHSMPVTYLPLGLDAAISSGSKDMRFQNPYSKPVVLKAGVTGKTLTVTFMVPADMLGGATYDFFSKQTGSLSATSYLTTYINGVESSTVKVDSSSYQSLN